MAMYSSRVIWEQHKEPALSAPLISFSNPQEDSLTLPYQLPSSVEDYTTDIIIDLARAAQIVDDLDGRELASKLEIAKDKKRVALLINAIDDEPYLSSKITPLLSLREEVVGGILLCQKITNTSAADVSLLVYRHMPGLHSSIPSRIADYKVVRTGSGFPARPTTRQLRQISRRPTLHIGVGAAIHLYRAVYQLKKQTTSFVTVHGNAVASPMNLEVSFDINATQVLERCGLLEPPTRVVIGGSMSGVVALDTDRTKITPTTRGVLAFVRKKQEFQYTCIGCGRCERACPAGLNPMYIHEFMQSGFRDKLTYYDPQYCIECGLCSYFCPSRLQVSAAVKEAKRLVASGQVAPPQSSYSFVDFKQTLNTVGGRLHVLGKAIGKGLKATGRGFVWLGEKLWAGLKTVGRGLILGAAWVQDHLASAKSSPPNRTAKPKTSSSPLETSFSPPALPPEVKEDALPPLEVPTSKAWAEQEKKDSSKKEKGESPLSPDVSDRAKENPLSQKEEPTQTEEENHEV